MKYLKRFESIEEKEEKYLIKIDCANNMVDLEKWINNFDHTNEYQRNEAEKYWSCHIYNVCKIKPSRISDSNRSNWEIALLERQPRRVIKEQDDISNGIILRLLRERVVDSGASFKGFKSLSLENKINFIEYFNENDWLINNSQISKVINKSEIEFELDNLIDYYLTRILNPA